MLRIKLEFEFDEEQLLDLFDNYDVKFSGAKLAKLKKEIKDRYADIQTATEEHVEEIVGEIIEELFD